MHLTISTHQKDEVIDISDSVKGVLAKQDSESGMVNIFVKHTTCCITTADLDPGTDLDLLDAIRGILPPITYRHPHDPSHTPDHILSSIIGASLNVPFEKKQLSLGIWQRVVLIELDGPRDRQIEITVI